MGACVGFSQCILVVFNLIFALFGLVFLVVGCVVRFGSHLLDDILQDFYSALQKLMEKAGSSSTLSSFNLGDYLQSATLSFIILGAFFFLLGLMGCIGACCKNKCCLTVYAIVVATIIVGEIVFVVLLFTIRDELETALESPLYDSLRNDYVGINSSDTISLGWNFAMITFKCCGVENYTDFQNASRWQRTYDVGQGYGVNLTVPVACCRLNGTFPNVVMPDNFTCAVSPTPQISNIDRGCYNALIDFLVDNSNILIGVGASIAAVEILLFVFALCVCLSDKRKKYDEVEDW